MHPLEIVCLPMLVDVKWFSPDLPMRRRCRNAIAVLLGTDSGLAKRHQTANPKYAHRPVYRNQTPRLMPNRRNPGVRRCGQLPGLVLSPAGKTHAR